MANLRGVILVSIKSILGCSQPSCGISCSEEDLAHLPMASIEWVDRLEEFALAAESLTSTACTRDVEYLAKIELRVTG